MKYQDVFVPWHYLAAVDQYERNIQSVRKDIPKRDSVVAIQFSDEVWAGPFNPNQTDTSIASIQYFGGVGLDGNGDGKADNQSDDDVMYTMARYLSQYGPSEEDFKMALWEYYKSEQVINQILTIAKLYKHYDTIEIDTHVFPLPVRGYNYSYRGTWGASRGWGGRRIHEGTDIFAGYGTPVVSTSYGVVEVMGWNEFGGWRIGIRDNHNSYHYYAHLAYYNKDLKVGDIVEPGTLLGGVGSTGYGKEGTSGKFPPHLHYGIYKFNGKTEWAFDPYPSLVQWEKTSRKKK
ncbi:peptidase M23, partial [Butyricicoccus sp. 1XD8-22]